MSKTYGEQFKEALACETKEQAEKWMLAEIERYYSLPDFSGGEGEARKIILCNIGYMAGYYGQAEQEKIYNLFGAEHPIFGKPADMVKVTPEQAFQAGKKFCKICLTF